MRNGGAPAPRGYQGAPPRGHHHTTGVPVHISVARLEEEYQNAALFADETGGALQPQTGKTYEHLDKGDPRDLDLLEGTQARQAGRRKAIKQSLWAVYCWSFLALLLLLAVVTACIMWMILPATHKHHHSSQRQLIAPLPEDRGPATPLSTTERFPLNWTVMVGDETMRATFMALARQVMQEKTLTSSFEPDDDEGSAVDPGTAGRVDAASADSDILDSVLLCNTMGQCKLVGGTCVHLQPLCETLLPAGAVAEEYCEAHGLNDLPQCTVENWERMIESFRWLQLQYVVSFHYVARAVGRGQPASLVDGALRPELGYSSLAIPLNTTKRLRAAPLENVVMNGCTHFFFPGNPPIYQWEADSFAQLLEIFAATVTNNIKLLRSEGYDGPVTYQGCAPYSCQWEQDFLASPSALDPDDGGMFYDLTSPVAPTAASPTAALAPAASSPTAPSPTAPTSSPPITGAYNADGTYDFGDNTTDVTVVPEGPLNSGSAPLPITALEGKRKRRRLQQAAAVPGAATGGASQPTIMESCQAKNYVVKQANKRLLKLFSDPDLGDVRFVDVERVMSMRPKQTCGGHSPACVSVHKTPQANLAGFTHNLGTPELSTAYNMSAVMAPMLAHMTMEAALPQYLEAAAQTCPCTVAQYNGYDGIMSNFLYQ